MKKKSVLVAVLSLILSQNLHADDVEKSSQDPKSNSEVAETKATTPQSPAKASSSVGLFHTPPKAEALPYPGQNVKLTVRLNGTRETERKLRLIYVKDGNFMDMASKEAVLNENDQPTYQIAVTAPLAEMSYQFILYNPDGSVLTSPRYAVRRNCIPNVDLAAGQVLPEVQGVERLQDLVNEAKHLENDLSSYDKIFSIMDRLQALIKP